MEGDQVPFAAPVPQPVAPKKNNNMIIVAAVVVAVIIIAIVGILLMGGSDDDGTGDDNGNDALEWIPAVGDYYEYTMKVNGVEMGTMKYRVTEVTSTTMTLNITSDYMGFQSYEEETVPLGLSLDYVDQIENPPYGYQITDKGSQSMSTEFGFVSTHHYLMSYSSEGNDLSMDMWLYKGMLVKMSGGYGGYEAVMELTDTNIDI